MKYDRTVIAYHGCDADTAERLLRGEAFKKSQNNAGKRPDQRLRRRDCAVINYYLSQLELKQAFFDTVRCGFVEGPPAFDGSGIRHQSHVQIAVRNPTCVVGVFRPTVVS